MKEGGKEGNEGQNVIRHTEDSSQNGSSSFLLVII